MLPRPGSGRKLNLSISAIRSNSSVKTKPSQAAPSAATLASGVEDGAPCMPRVLWGDNASPLPQQQPQISLSLHDHHTAEAEPMDQEPDAAALHGSPVPVSRRPRRSRASGQPMVDPGAAWDMQQFMTSSQQELQQLKVGRVSVASVNPVAAGVLCGSLLQASFAAGACRLLHLIVPVQPCATQSC
jgi:hypothetical protein